MRLRGQAGTDALMPGVWPADSWFVLLDGAPRQIALALAERGLERHYRIGPALRPYTDTTYVHDLRAFAGNGLRPLSPVHLRANLSGGDLSLSWVRRTRIDGDSWAGYEVPLGEESELYLVRVGQGGSILREAIATGPAWSYTSDLQAADGLVPGAWTVRVAQISAAFGPGPFASQDLMT